MQDLPSGPETQPEDEVLEVTLDDEDLPGSAEAPVPAWQPVGAPPSPPPPPPAVPEMSKPQAPAEEAQWYVAQGGQTWGPYPTGTVRAWLRERRLSAETPISRGGGDPWRPLWELPEFREALPPFGAAAPGAAPASYGHRSAGPVPAISVLLSLLLPGLGQVYNGQTVKGLSLMAAGLVVGLALVGLVVVSLFVALRFAGLILLAWWCVWAVDAGLVGARVQRGERVAAWRCF